MLELNLNFHVKFKRYATLLSRISMQLQEKLSLHRAIHGNRGNRISLTNVGKVALCFASFSFEKGSWNLNHRVKLAAPSVQPGCNPTSTIISLEVVAPTCIRTRCTWSRAIVRGTSFGGIHVARELRSRCAADRTKKTVEHRPLHSLPFFTSRS